MKKSLLLFSFLYIGLPIVQLEAAPESPPHHGGRNRIERPSRINIENRRNFERSRIRVRDNNIRIEPRVRTRNRIDHNRTRVRIDINRDRNRHHDRDIRIDLDRRDRDLRRHRDGYRRIRGNHRWDINIHVRPRHYHDYRRDHHRYYTWNDLLYRLTNTDEYRVKCKSGDSAYDVLWQDFAYSSSEARDLANSCCSYISGDSVEVYNWNNRLVERAYCY